MEFWGVEVKSGQSLVVKPDRQLLHISQACLDEVKKAKGSEPISLFVKSGGQKLVLGYLSAEKISRVSFDLIFDKEFELSHNWKNGSVHFTGYKSLQRPKDLDAEEDEPLAVADNGRRKVNTEEAKKAIKSDENEATSDDDESDDEESDADQAIVKNEEDSTDEDESTDDDDSEDETDDSDEETPKKADVSKKRPAESTKTPANDKKAKFITPEKTGSKKGSVHTATPHPAKQAGKKPSTSDSSKQISFHCPPCNRSFNSDGALQSHTKAKHSAAK